MNIKKVRLGLIGKDVSQSHSARIHTFILKEWGIACEYEQFSVLQEDFDSAMRRLLGDFDGFNVTIPYKRDVMGYLDEISDDAFSCGAVNTVLTKTGCGYNTDGRGFLLMLREHNIDLKGKRVLVLGGGGAGRSTAASLKNSGAEVFLYQRRKEKLQEVCAQLGVQSVESPETGGYDILINCTGVGMHNTEGFSPVSISAFDGATVAVDLIYRPKESQFLQVAKEKGLKTINGEAMLFYQAYFADCIYAGREASDAEAIAMYQKYCSE